MMKQIIVFVVAFVVGLGGAAGAKVMLTKPAPAPAKVASDSTHAGPDAKGDSAAAATKAIAEAADTAHAVPPAQPESAKTVAAVTAAPTGVPAVNIKPALPTPPGAAQTSAATDTATQTAEKRLAKVFTSMEAKQAAAVLAHMSDADVHVILGYVGPKQAAGILAEMPPERVATLTKIAMQRSGGSK